MNKGIIRVDFGAKQVIEAPMYNEDQVYGAIAVLEGFLKDDLKQKELDINNALQIWDHDLEDMTDEELDKCDAVAALKRRRALRQNRRQIKSLQDLQYKVKKTITIGNINNVVNVTSQHSEKMEKGSCDAFFENSVARKSLENKTLLKNSRIKVEEDKIPTLVLGGSDERI